RVRPGLSAPGVFRPRLPAMRASGLPSVADLLAEVLDRFAHLPARLALLLAGFTLQTFTGALFFEVRVVGHDPRGLLDSPLEILDLAFAFVLVHRLASRVEGSAASVPARAVAAPDRSSPVRSRISVWGSRIRRRVSES